MPSPLTSAKRRPPAGVRPICRLIPVTSVPLTPPLRVECPLSRPICHDWSPSGSPSPPRTPVIGQPALSLQRGERVIGTRRPRICVHAVAANRSQFSTPPASSPARPAPSSWPISGPRSSSSNGPAPATTPRLGPPLGRNVLLLSAHSRQTRLCPRPRQAQGSELFHELIDKSDVLIENFRTDSAEKMGLGPSSCSPGTRHSSPFDHRLRQTGAVEEQPRL